MGKERALSEQTDGDGGESPVEELRRSMKRRFRLVTGGLVALTLILAVAPVAANHLTVRSSDIVDGAVRTPDLHDNSVKSAKINDGAVHTKDLRNNSVGSVKLKQNAVRRRNLGAPIRTKSSGWMLSSSADDLFFDGTNLTHKIIDAPAITQEVIDNGGVEVYMRFFDRTWSLPYVSHAGGEPSTLDFFLTPGQIHITRFSPDNSPVAIGGILYFRYVIVPEQQAVGPASPAGATEADAERSADSSTE